MGLHDPYRMRHLRPSSWVSIAEMIYVIIAEIIAAPARIGCVQSVHGSGCSG